MCPLENKRAGLFLETTAMSRTLLICLFMIIYFYSPLSPNDANSAASKRLSGSMSVTVDLKSYASSTPTRPPPTGGQAVGSSSSNVTTAPTSVTPIPKSGVTTATPTTTTGGETSTTPTGGPTSGTSGIESGDAGNIRKRNCQTRQSKLVRQSKVERT